MDLGTNKSFLAQSAHVGWAIALTLAAGRLLPVYAAAGVIAAFAATKEALESLGWAFWEPRQDWPSSILDFAFWMMGTSLAAILLLLTHKG